MMTSLKRGSVTTENSYLTHSLKVYIQTLTTASGIRLFGSVVEHWTFNSAARFQIPPQPRNLFSALFAILSSLLRLSCCKNSQFQTMH